MRRSVLRAGESVRKLRADQFEQLDVLFCDAVRIGAAREQHAEPQADADSNARACRQKAALEEQVAWRVPRRDDAALAALCYPAEQRAVQRDGCGSSVGKLRRSGLRRQ